MSPDELLHLVVEASLALAGFAGVVNALMQRRTDQLSRLHHLNLVNLLATALGALFLSLAALVLLSAGTAEALVWRLVSGVGLLVTLYFAVRSTRTVVSAVGDSGVQGVGTLLVINVPLLLVCVLQIWNAAWLAAFWPVFLLLTALFAVGCFSFTRLLFSSSG